MFSVLIILHPSIIAEDVRESQTNKQHSVLYAKSNVILYIRNSMHIIDVNI